MAVSRYDNFARIRSSNKDYLRMETFPSIKAEDLENIPHSIVVWKETDRMDIMAQDFFGDARYWWIICMMNDLVSPFSYTLLPGTLLRIPYDAASVINIINRNLMNLSSLIRILGILGASSESEES